MWLINIIRAHKIIALSRFNESSWLVGDSGRSIMPLSVRPGAVVIYKLLLFYSVQLHLFLKLFYNDQKKKKCAHL